MTARTDALAIVEQALIDSYINHTKAHILNFWVGPDWKWQQAREYLPRLRDSQVMLGKRIHWSKLSPIGIESWSTTYIDGYHFKLPQKDGIAFRRDNNDKTGDMNIKASNLANIKRMREMHSLCVQAGFMPVFALEYAGDSEFIPSGVVCPREEDAVALDAWWNA